jgi:hypothetical protein
MQRREFHAIKSIRNSTFENICRCTASPTFGSEDDLFYNEIVLRGGLR